MGKNKFIDKKKAATFVLMHRETDDADDDVSARVFTRVDSGFAPVPGFSEEDPRSNPDYGYDTDGAEEEEDEAEDENGGVAFEESSVFADADEDDDVRSRRSVASRASRRSTASRAARQGPMPEHVRVELVELGFPDDGYDYMQHLRKIGVSGVGGSFVPTTLPKPEKLRADVKVNCW
jgi:protein LTV1